MKTIKIIMVLIFAAALFYSCAENTSDYGTLVISPSGSNSTRVTAEVTEDNFYVGFKEGLTFTIECVNTNDSTVVKSDSYDADGTDHDVSIQLLSGNWDVWVKVHKEERGEIGKEKYPNTVTIRAGQTVQLGGIRVKINGFGYGDATARKVEGEIPFNNVDEANALPWDNTLPLSVDKFLSIKPDGDFDDTGRSPKTKGARGTARILWSDSYLYVKVDVVDAEMEQKTSPTDINNAHKIDSVEIFINEDGIGGTGYQYRVDFRGKSSFGKVKNNNYSSNYEPYIEGFESLVPPSSLPSSYTVYAKIPFISEKTDRNKIGIDFQINGNTLDKEGRTSIAVWYKETHNYNNPDNYVDSLTLVE